jgi:amino acid adenylation domain-containing protein
MSLVAGFFDSVSNYPERPALEVGDDVYSYAHLQHRTGQIARILTREAETSLLVGVLAYRSLTAYAGILGTLMSGRGYVPLHPDYPAKRASSIVDRSELTSLVIGRECLDALTNLLRVVQRDLTLIFPDDSVPQGLINTYGQHRFIGKDEVRAATALDTPPDVAPDDLAYLMFTSGSTGIPKGVPITHANATAYLDFICERFSLGPGDRFSQMSDITFDVSVHDMFVCWSCGASLCVVPREAQLAPAAFIRKKAITMWASVPTVAVLLKKMRMLKPGIFPSLRASIFSGEALPATAAQAWARAAPNSLIENHYGATEATVNFTAYRWERGTDPASCVSGIVPIGHAFAKTEICLIKADGKAVTAGETGELCVSGPQVTPGYWNEPERNEERFIQLEECGSARWYRTGDLAHQDDGGVLHYRGRVDHQVQIRGYRVELQEVDVVLRRAAGTELAATVAWPVHDGRAEGLVAFVEGGDKVRLERIREQCEQHLPPYMVPQAIHVISHMPLNENRKIDRKRLVEQLDHQAYA